MNCSRSGGRRLGLIGLATFSVVGMLTCNAAQAVLIAYEPFNYTAGSAVLGASGGTGFSGAWVTPRPSTGGATPAGSNTVGAGSLAAPVGLTTIGNHAIFTGQFGTMDGLSRSFPNVPGADGTTTWVSFLAQRQGETTTNVPGNLYPRGANVGLYDTQATSQGGTANERVGIGNSSNATTDAWSLIPQGGGGNRAPSPDDPWSTLSWGVVRIDHIGAATDADTAYMWINPDPLGGEPLIANADVTLLNTATNARDYSNVDFIRPFVGGNAGTAGMPDFRPFAVMVVDEIRLGTTWDDMRDTAGIPEPTSCVLLILGGLAICVRRSKG